MELQTLNPSQVRYPAKAVLRTLVQVVITMASVIPWLVSAVNDAAAGTTVAPQLSAAGVQALAVAGVVTRLMALPEINAALTKFGLGARPSDAPAVVLVKAPQMPQDEPEPLAAPVIPDPPPEPPAAVQKPYGRHAAIEG